MPNEASSQKLTRRGAIAGLGAAGVVLAHSASQAFAGDAENAPRGGIPSFLTVAQMIGETALSETLWVRTLGFHQPGDGGDGLYQILPATGADKPNGSDCILLKNGLVAVLHERRSVNYKLFGAVGDGKNNDGVQIKLAHEYALKHNLPIDNQVGEFWITGTYMVPIRTNVNWGKTIFHIDERYNARRAPRFVVQNDEESKNLTADKALHKALVEKLKPGVSLISELAPYAGHLFVVKDDKDRIGIRAGYANNKGWAREELFYVEEEGRILGDIAWEFKDLTSIQAIPCNDNYLVVEGGCFYLSGDTPSSKAPGYYHNGISIQRSRTTIRNQWMGLEPGKRDESLEPRHGLYVLSHVYDVTLENIRAMPWEQGRKPPKQKVKHGTYGIGGSRWLNCTFRNLTAEGGWVAWGVFGTNMNKNFRVENCQLNRVDVHFHCWNLYISNSILGYKGVTATGGGEMIIENCIRHGNQFVGFRSDYGAKWDGTITLRNCRLKPVSEGGVSVLVMHPRDFDYKYPVGYGRNIKIEGLCIDYSEAPGSTSPCHLLSLSAFSQIGSTGERLFFPQQITFRDVTVEHREKGVRLVRIPNPYHYELFRKGSCDQGRFRSNSTLICDTVQLEETTPETAGDLGQAHFYLGGKEAAEYRDALALFPKLVFTDCDNIALYLGNCGASAFFQRCTINTIKAQNLRGELTFSDCRLQPEVQKADEAFYALDCTLGTRFSNCVFYAPIVNGESKPELMDKFGFLTINQKLRHYHLNSSLGNEVVEHFKKAGKSIGKDYVAKLMLHHGQEE